MESDWKYFKKYDPNNPFATQSGTRLQFKVLSDQWGILASRDNYVIKQLRLAQSEQRGGVMEITAEEYRDLEKKKPMDFLQLWGREMLGHLQVRRLYESVRAGVAAGGKLPPGVQNVIDEVRALTKPQGVSTFVPKVGKR
jgi:hypothetical protein